MASSSARQALRVFVGNLPWTISTNELRHFASSFGAVNHAHVVFDKKTGLSKGYGFVNFGNREAYNAVIKGGTSGAGIYFLEGHHINVSPAQQSGGGVSASEDN